MRLLLLSFLAALAAAQNLTGAQNLAAAQNLTGAQNLAAAQSLAAAQNRTAGTAGVPFEVRASAPGTPVDNRTMTASNLTFFLNGMTASTCPLSSGCPPGNRTVLNGDASSLVRPLPHILSRHMLTTSMGIGRPRPRRPADLRHRRWCSPLHPGSLACDSPRRVYGSLLSDRRGLAFYRPGGA
jgi:hypothetical protein